MASSTDSDQPGAPDPQAAVQPPQDGAQSEEAARKLLRVQLLVLTATVAAILAVLLVAHVMRSASAPITQRQVESKLDYLVGSSAVAVYDALDGYPVVFMMPDDGNPLGTWLAANAGAGSSSAADGAGQAGGASPRAYTDVTYQVQTAAHNDYALDDERYQVTGYASPDKMTGQITVYVTELFRMYEEELSQTLPIGSAAAALQAYGDGAYPGGFELLSVRATSVEAESGTWVVRGTARAMDPGAPDAEPPADADGWRNMEFTARVSGSGESPQVDSFSPLA